MIAGQRTVRSDQEAADVVAKPLVTGQVWIHFDRPVLTVHMQHGAEPLPCGQILVLHDMLGLYEDFTPKFVKRYARLAEQMRRAVKDYKEEVRAGKFPDREHSFE